MQTLTSYGSFEEKKLCNERKLTESSTLISWIRYPWVRKVLQYHRCAVFRALFQVSIVRFVQIHAVVQSCSVQIVLNTANLCISFRINVKLFWLVSLILNTYEIQMECHHESPFFHQKRLICYWRKKKSNKEFLMKIIAYIFRRHNNIRVQTKRNWGIRRSPIYSRRRMKQKLM